MICLEQVLVRHRGQKVTVKRKTLLLTDQPTSEGQMGSGCCLRHRKLFSNTLKLEIGASRLEV